MSERWLVGDVDTVTAWDAAWCPDPVPLGLVPQPYIGGSSVDHQWEPDELKRVEHLPRLPIWVPTPGVDDPRRAAADCIARCKELGIPAKGPSGRHTRIMWDLETGREPAPEWLAAARRRMLQAGFFILPYGSTSYLFEYQPAAGYVVANPTGQPHLFEHPNVEGTQYAWGVPTPGGPVNMTVFNAGILPALWQPAK